MPEINKLTAADSVTAGDLLAAFINSNGDTRKIAMSVLLAYIQTNIVLAYEYETQYASPGATGFSVNVSALGVGTHLILTPAAGYATGTIVLPAVGTLADKQEIIVTSTRQITTLTINGNGAAAVNGGPSSLGADGFFHLKYDAIFHSWFRVG